MAGVQSASGRMLREQIDVMVREGVSLEEIERELIDDAPLTEDLRSALWLYAWGCLGRQSSPLPVV